MTDSLVNSGPWWDSYHRTTWSESGGGEQTRMFMEALLAHLPAEVAAAIHTHRLELVDWGCATGEGAAVLRDAFPESRVGGLDVAAPAIERARGAFPGLWFETCEGTALPRDFDVVVTSNCLEHFRAPLPIVREHLAACRWYYVALVPYNEHPLHEQHFAQFREESFPEHLAGFTRTAAKVLTPPRAAWDGEQLLVVYASPRALAGSRDGPDTAPRTGADPAIGARLDDLHAAVQLLVAERAWRGTADRIWKSLEASERRVDALQSRLAEATAARRELEIAHARELERTRDALAGLRQQAQETADERDARAAELAAASARAASLSAELEQARREHGEVAAAFTAYRAWIESSRLLKVARSVGNPRQLLFPKGSWRERTAWKLKLRASAAWHGLRRGADRAARAPATIDGARPRFPGMVDGAITVVLPVYNQAYLLADGIQSVLDSSAGDFELIVLDDGSKDDVTPVLERYRDDPRVRVLRQTNARLPKALSNAFEFARGEFRCWTSADNLMGAEQLERQRRFLEDHADTAMVYCDYEAIDDRGELLRDPSFRPHNRRSPTDPAIHVQRDTAQLNVVKDNFIGPCFMYRGIAGMALGEYDPRLGLEDYDYWMRMNHEFVIRHLGSDALLYRYRVHDNSLSGRAVELGIHAQAEALMAYEKERAVSYRAPLPVVAEAALANAVALPPEVATLAAGAPLPTGPAILLTTPERVADLAARGVPGDVAVVAVVGADPVPAFRQRIALRNGADHVIALDADVGEFLGVLHPGVWIADAVATALPVIRAAWRNDCFYRAHRPAELRERRLPRPFRGARRQKLLIQVDRLGAGGMEHVVAVQAREMAARGLADVALVILEATPSAKALELFDGVRIVDLSTAADRRAAYRELLETEAADLVNAHYSTFGCDLAAARGIPFVQTVHNTYVWLDAGQRARLADADRHTAGYLCVSDRVAFYAWRRLGLDPRKMVVQVNPARAVPEGGRRGRDEVLRSAGLTPGRFTFLNVASVYAAKAQIVLVEALGRLAAAGRTAQVLVIGATMEPAYKERLVQRARELGVADRLGFVEHTDEIGAFYRAADAFVLPSYWEGWSLAANEAAALGLPLVLARVGAAEEIDQFAGAVLVDPPFAEVDELRAETLGRHVHGVDDAYVGRFAAAMQQAIDAPRRPRADRLAAALSPATVFDACGDILEWIAQGGAAAAARPWAFQAWRRAEDTPGRAFRRSLLVD